MAYKFNPFTGKLDEVGAGGGGSTSPGGSDTQIQFNDGGSFGGDADLTWNKTTNLLDINGDIQLDDGGTYTTTIQCVTPTLTNKTISFPDATGTVALVAGSSGQLVYNNAGSNAGLTSANIGSTGQINVSLAGAASTPPVTFTGSWFTGGTATTTKPQLLIEPTGTTSTAWSTSGTGIGVNAASGFTGRLLDLQTNGTSYLAVSGTGGVNFTPAAGSSLSLIQNRIFHYAAGAAEGVSFGNYTSGHGFIIGPSASLAFAPVTAFAGNPDVSVIRSAAGVIKVTNGSTGDGTISGQLRAVGTAPASASATGTAGDIRYDADYIYVCTATDTWKRAALATW